MLQNSAEVRIKKTFFFIVGITSNWIFLLGMKEYWYKNICEFQLQKFIPFVYRCLKLGLPKMYEANSMICYHMKQFS